MPTTKADLTEFSISQLAFMTRKHQATVSKKLREAGVKPIRTDSQTIYYAPHEAFPVLYGGKVANHLDEKAKLDETKREKLDLEIAKMRGELLETLDVQAMGAAVMSGVSMKVMSLRNMAPEVRAAGSDAEGADILEEAAREALSEIARMGAIVGEVRRKERPDAAGVDDSSEAAAETDGERVGGLGAEAQP